MTITAHQLLSELRRRGLEVRAAPGGRTLRYRPRALVTPEVRDLLARRKAELLAVLTGRPAASHVPGVEWCPHGGVRLSDPPDPRALCLEHGRRHGFPRLRLAARAAEWLCEGEAAWRAFAAAAAGGDVAGVLLQMDDLPAAAEPPGPGAQGCTQVPMI